MKYMKPLRRATKLGQSFLDISKAFDKVWHRGLFWFASYLSNRKQRVVIEGVHSDWRNIVTGVLRGQS